jgi:hypothetical protein
LLRGSAAAVAICLFASAAQAKGFVILHSFAGGPGDGAYPYNNVSFDADGATPQAGVVKRRGRLYGMASGGGSDEFGVVYSLKK